MPKDYQITRLTKARDTVKGEYISLLHEQDAVQQTLYKIEDKLLALDKKHKFIDRALAKIDGRYKVIIAKRQYNKTKTHSKAKTTPMKTYSQEDVVALLQQIPEHKRQGFISKVFDNNSN